MDSRAKKIRVLVADDSPAALRSICKYMELAPDFEIVGTATDGLELLRQTELLRPDLVLTDLRMPRKNGLEAAEKLRKTANAVRIIIITELSGPTVHQECARSKVDGFVPKDQAPERLFEEVRRLFPADSSLD